MNFLCDRKILAGIGIGLIIGVVSMLGFKYNTSLTRAQIEEKAKGYGMDYPSEFKVLNSDKDVKK